MKKNLYACMDRHRKVMKLILMMKATFILSVLFALQVHAGVYSQQVRLSMNLEKATIKQVIGEIKRNTDYSFVYSDADIAGMECVDVFFKNEPVENILTVCLKGTGLKFAIEEKTIIIWKGTPVKQDVVEERILRGMVVDKKGEPLPGTTVILKGTALGVVTDTAGVFKIMLPAKGKQVLVFSFVGMKKREMEVTPDMSSVNIMLEEDSENLDDVVVTGYMKRSKSSYAGAVQTMKSDDLVATGATSLIESLKGLIPGVEIRQSGLVGSNPIIKVRGCNRLEESTITGNSAPLFVIDGFIMNDMSCYNMLNPKDIETMTVLKDAEAMSLYGSRGANGVIVITTKKGKNDRMQVKLGANMGFVDLGKNRLDVMSSRETLEWERILYRNYCEYYGGIEVDDEKVENFRPESMLDNTTDWYDEALSGSWTGDVNLSASGGNERTQFFVQGSYTHEAGVVKRNDMERFGLSANLQHRANERVSISFNTTAYRTEVKNNITAEKLYEDIQKMSPLTGAYDPKTGELLDGTQADFKTDVGNPLYNYKLNHSENVNYRFAAGATADIQLLPFLNWNSQFGYEVTKYNSSYYSDPRTQKDPYSLDKGVMVESHQGKNSFSWRSMLSVNKFWENHSLTGFASVEYQYEDEDYLYLTGKFDEPVLIQNLSSVKNVTNTKEMNKSNFMGIVFQAEYGYKGKYYLSGSVRTDGSSRFGGNNKWGTFGSVGVAYYMKNEAFLENAGWIDILKLRATYGRVGNANFGSSFSHYTVYQNAQYNYANKYPTYSKNHYKNESLKWETTDVYNVGVDFGFFNDRFSGNIDYYFKKTTGLLENLYLPLSTGESYQLQNTASVQNQGLEIFMQSQNIRREFRWSTNFNISFNRNKVLSLRNGVDEINDFTFYCKVGKTMECYFLPEWAGVDPENGEPLWFTGEENETTNDYYSARKVFVSREDRYRGGLNNFFSWKNLHLGVNILFANVSMLDNLSMNYTDADGANFGGMYFKDSAKNYWKKPGDQVARPRPMRYGNNSSNQSSTRYVIDGFFARIQSVNLSYDLPEKWMGKILKSATVYFRGNNLWYIYSDHPMLDPDAKSGMMSILTQGVSVPTGRNYQFGIDLVF